MQSKLVSRPRLRRPAVARVTVRAKADRRTELRQNDDTKRNAEEAGALWGRAAGFLLPVLAAAAALAASWQRWINPFVDSGRELDVPWRLAQGERLYRDISYYYGPLGPWVNALALRLFGNRWLVLEVVCAALSAVIFLLLFRLIRRAGSLLSATVATTLAAALCMGAPRGGAFIFPYSSSSLFALAGGLLAMDAAASEPRRRLLIALGLAIALAARLEIGVAAALVIVIAGVRSRRREETRGDLAAVAAGSVLAIAIYWIACAGIPWPDLITDGPFGPFLAMPQEWKSLYLQVSGLGEPDKSVSRIAVSLFLDVLLLAAAAFLALPRPGRPARTARRHLFAVTGLLALAAYLCSPLCDSLKNLPPLLAILPLVALGAALALLRRPLEEGCRRSRFLLFGFSAAVASRVLLGMTVGPRMSPYSALPLPGLLATAAVLAFDVLAPRLPAPQVFRRRLAALFAVLGALFLYRLVRMDHTPQTVELQTAAGALRLPAREAGALAGTLRFVESHARAGETLTAFPEGGFFNFVLGLRSPLRQDLIVPGVLAGAREAAAARRVGTAGPKYILLCNRPTPEYGPVAFGLDYAAGLWREVESDYALTGAFGWARPTAPVGSRHFFIRLYERKPLAPAAAQLPSFGLRRPPSVSTARLP
jgi:4-amino-4-deoxy-L-arabinose transferase-like glycosyltransferase